MHSEGCPLYRPQGSEAPNIYMTQQVTKGCSAPMVSKDTITILYKAVPCSSVKLSMET